jgi:hypothetical protein
LEESTSGNVQHDFLGGVNHVLEQGPMEIKQSNIESDEQVKTRTDKLEHDIQCITKEIEKISENINLGFTLLNELELDYGKYEIKIIEAIH